MTNGDKFSIELEIHGHDNNLPFELLNANSITVGDKAKIGEDMELTYKKSHLMAGVDFPTISCFILTFGTSISSGIIATWIYDKLKGNKVGKLIINRKEVVLEDGEIKKIIDETIRMN